MKQTRLADRLTANQIEAKNVEERNLSEMKRDMGDSHISFQRSRRIKNKTSVKLKRSKEKRLASIRREPAEPEELYSEDSLEINELLQQRQEEKSQKHQKIFSNIMSGVLIAGCVYVYVMTKLMNTVRENISKANDNANTEMQGILRDANSDS